MLTHICLLLYVYCFSLAVNLPSLIMCSFESTPVPSLAHVVVHFVSMLSLSGTHGASFCQHAFYFASSCNASLSVHDHLSVCLPSELHILLLSAHTCHLWHVYCYALSEQICLLWHKCYSVSTNLLSLTHVPLSTLSVQICFLWHMYHSVSTNLPSLAHVPLCQYKSTFSGTCTTLSVQIYLLWYMYHSVSTNLPSLVHVVVHFVSGTHHASLCQHVCSLLYS